MHNLIFKAIVGSQAYGTSTPQSDIDYKGIYMQPEHELLSFGYKEQVEVGKDECYYEVRRFLQLLKSANPTVLELLYSPSDCIIQNSPQFLLLVQHRDKFLTKKCLNSFGGYAVAQIKKAKGLGKKMNWEKGRMERKDVLDFCYVLADDSFKSVPVRHWLNKNNKKQEFCGLAKIDHFRDSFNLFYDYLAEMKNDNPRFEGGCYGFRGIIGEDSNEVRLSDIPKDTVRETVLYFNREGYSTHCSDYAEYQVWMKERNPQRFIDVKGHNQKIDGKNMLHCRRLLDMAMEIATEKTITVRRKNADYLLQIRRGEVELQYIIDKAENDLLDLDSLYAKSELPDNVDDIFMNDLLLQIRYLKN